MLGSRAREVKRLKAQVARLVDERDDALRDVASERAARSIIAWNFAIAGAVLAHAMRRQNALAARLDRAVRACARYRAAIAAQERLIRDQQRQLDDVYGLNSERVNAGAHWQQRREDKRPVKPGEVPSDGT